MVQRARAQPQTMWILCHLPETMDERSWLGTLVGPYVDTIAWDFRSHPSSFWAFWFSRPIGGFAPVNPLSEDRATPLEHECRLKSPAGEFAIRKVAPETPACGKPKSTGAVNRLRSLSQSTP